MFDIGFWELSLIAVVALLVIGPERLPKVARTAGLWVGKARSIVSSVKADIDREIAAEELKKTLQSQEKSNPLHEIIEETQSIADDARKSLDETRQAFEQTDNSDTSSSQSDSSENGKHGST
jgi:sec-independent protein translocase protein TatB